MKGLRINKTVKEIKFEVVCGELETQKYFQRHSFTKYSRLTLIFKLESLLISEFNLNEKIGKAVTK